MKANQLLASYDEYGLLGELSGASQADLDKLFRKAHQQLQDELQAARRQAAEQNRQISIDASRLSGVIAGDWIRVAPDQTSLRQLTEFPEVVAGLLGQNKPADSLPACASLDDARPLLARCAYNGLWSPSGTNWQPIRTVELSAAEVALVMSQPAQACGLLVLARRQYQSVLSDIAGLCGFEQTSHAEQIDLAIWLLAAEQTAAGHGWRLDSLRLAPQDQARATEKMIKILSQRIKRLSGPSQLAAKELIQSLEADDHYPAIILEAFQGRELITAGNQPGGLMPAPFDRLVAARSTQRVASPSQDLAREQLSDLFESAYEFLAQNDNLLSSMIFGWQEELTAKIGQAMHAGIEGPNGLLSRASLANLSRLLRDRTDLPDDLEAWTGLEEDQLEARGKEIAIPARLIPRHICAKLTEGGQFRVEDDFVLDQRGRRLTPVRLIKIVRMMSRAFGKFFLSFENTHPLLGIILVKTSADSEKTYRAAGRLVAHMTFLARARGFTSIIKSGPLEIAGAAIQKLLTENTSDQPAKQKLSQGELVPVLTFQLGMPLGPDELVAPGQPNEHSGLAERLLDKRAPRAPLAAHYIPLE
ncbi:MAG: hypothetical protein JRJ87_12425 [Deltaproteobacteria bacterium]|nr:hypothetical protein [Deltaproteobacteria bacterium]